MTAQITADPVVRYGRSDAVFTDFVPLLESMMERYRAKNILEVGGGANPSFPLEQIERNGWDYTLLDVAEGELAKAPSGYKKVHADISSAQLGLNQRFDFIFSKMLIEHVKDAELMHRNIYQLLAPGGVVFHFFPTMFAPPYVVNWLVPEWLSGFILRLAHPERNHQGHAGKFPAYYSWCFGPTAKQLKRFEKIGYQVEAYVGLYGHSYYYEKIPIVRNIHQSIVSFLIQHPNPWVTSYAYIVLRKGPI